MNPLNKISVVLPFTLMVSCSDTTTNDYQKMGVEPHLDATVMNINQTDRQFLYEAAQANIDEIQLSMPAEDNGANEQVKQLAAMTEADHSSSLDDIHLLAQKKKLQLPAIVSPDEKAHYKMLSCKSGPEVDREYCNIIIKSHKETIERFERELSVGQDEDIKKFAMATLPKLKKHLLHALAIIEKNNPTDMSKRNQVKKLDGIEKAGKKLI